MPKMPPDTAIDRYTAVANVLAKVATGMRVSRAIRAVANTPVLCLSGHVIRPSVRTLQRWLFRYQDGGFSALTPKSRMSAEPSRVLSTDFINFLIKTKERDPDASIPEIIRQAHLLAVVDCGAVVSRVSVWRAARRLNLPIFATKGIDTEDMRRFEFAHRMQMTLGDGKKFRAGIKSRRRVAITIIDDASRMILGVTVGKTETAELFLRCLWKVITRWGKPENIFLDNGSGFIARDVAIIAARLGIGLIFGTKSYPEGHGKIERYHSTLIQDLLRTFRNNPLIDADCKALEHRLEHYNTHIYNRNKHESLPNISPEMRFLGDKLALQPISDPEKIRQHFIIASQRKVSRDNVVSLRGILYELPRGHAGKLIFVYRHLLDQNVSFLHDGKMVDIHRLDPILNSQTRRRPKRHKDTPKLLPPKTAATIAFERDHQPLVGDAGDCYEEK